MGRRTGRGPITSLPVRELVSIAIPADFLRSSE